MRKIKFATLIIVGILIAFILPLTLIQLGSNSSQSEMVVESSLKELSSKVNSRSDLINGFLSSAKEDILFLSQLSSLNSFVENNNELSRQNLENDFLMFSNERDIYYQVRYLDASGQEIVRVDSDGFNVALIPQDNLQNKKGRYYFDDAFDLNEREVFVSPLDLNIEKGAIENRGTTANPSYVPVIRYGTPVFDDKGNKKGIVLTNIYADFLLDILEERSSGVDDAFYLLNLEGYYLHHLERSKEWGFMFENQEKVQNDFPSFSDKLFEEKSGQFFDRESGKFVTFLKIYPNEPGTVSSSGSSKAYAESTEIFEGDDYFWILLSTSSEEEILSPLSENTTEIISYSLIAAIFLAVFAFLFSRFITKQISRITYFVEKITTGELGIELGESKIVEIQNLIDSLNRVLASMKLAILRTKKQQTKTEVGKKIASKSADKKVIKDELSQAFTNNFKNNVSEKLDSEKNIVKKPLIKNSLKKKIVEKKIKEKTVEE